MLNGISIRLAGAQAADTTKALATRLVELGKPVERLDDAHAQIMGGPPGANTVCGMLSRHGVAVLAAYTSAEPEGAVLDVAIDDNDTPDFAAEKVLDKLEERGVVALGSETYSPEEEEAVRKRLAELGYIE